MGVHVLHRLVSDEDCCKDGLVLTYALSVSISNGIGVGLLFICFFLSAIEWLPVSLFVWWAGICVEDGGGGGGGRGGGGGGQL